MIIYCASPKANTDYNYSFTNITVKDGLSFNEVTAIIEDHQGFMWFGTRGGLNRWDGYNFTVFKGQPGNEESLSPSIESLYQDSKNRIWIGTKTRGAFVFNPETEIIEQVPFSNQLDSKSTSDKQIISITEDKSNNIWLGGFSHGLNKLIAGENNVKYFGGNQKIGCITQSKDSTIWLAADGGLLKIMPGQDVATNVFRPYSGYVGFTDIIEDPSQPVFWITGWRNGLIKYNYETGDWKEYAIPSSPNGYALTMDHAGNIWLGTWGQGLWHFDPKTEKMVHIQFPSAVLGKEAILSLFCDHNGDMWTGTSFGVYKISQRLPFRTKQISANGKESFVSIFMDDDENFYAGTNNRGLFVSQKLGEFKLLNEEARVWSYAEKPFQNGILCADDRGLYLLKQGKYSQLNVFSRGTSGEITPFLFSKQRTIKYTDEQLWIGSQQRGLYCFEWVDGYGFVESPNTPHQKLNQILNTKRISAFIEDKQKRLWVGTYEGLFVLNPGADNFVPIIDLTEQNIPISNDIVLNIKQDIAGNIWVGTPLGLTRLSPTRSGAFKVSYYDKDDGLADDYILAIEIDQTNKIWVSHNKGISSINIIDDEILNYDESNGIFSNAFGENISCSKNGILYFVGDNAISHFDPQKIWINERIPPMAFTNLYLQNKKVSIGESIKGRVILDKSLNHTDELVLNYSNNYFSVEFAALNFDSPEKNQYQYKLDGRDDSWITIGKNHIVSLDNLKPGSYVLQIKGSNNNNIWNDEGKSLNIKILPPFWVTWYAFLIYLGIILFILFFIRWNILKQESLNRNLEISRLEREKEHQVNEMKLRFYTNISHEFRTPLTLILGPVNDLLSTLPKTDEVEANFKGKLIGIKRNAQDLLHLINQLMDFRKVETGNFQLQVQATEIKPFFENILNKYKELASLQKVSFSYHFNIEHENAWIDQDKLVKISNNLLSNAFKYLRDTDRNISVEISDTPTLLILKVKDNGLGIPQDKLDKIFNRFYQLEESPSLNSSGIGLSLVSHFTQLHHGAIQVKSAVNEYTVFSLEFPLNKNRYAADEISTKKQTLKPKQDFKDDIPQSEIQTSNTVAVNAPIIKKGQKLLIVEDNKEVQDYLHDIFENDFELFRADNGVDGFEMATNHMPNIIISDVMMPEMDGFEMCQKLRQNLKTETIPIILLTAKDSKEAKVHGTKAGADAYIPKPFDPDYLRVKVSRILEAQEKLKSEYSKKVVLAPSNVEISSYEGELIEKAIALIEENISNTNFDIDHFASAMNMSKTTLYRRLKSVSGSSPSEFVRTIRIKRAEKLLHNREKTISEISWETGFSDPKVFRNAFEKEFGMKPMKYRQLLDNKG